MTQTETSSAFMFFKNDRETPLTRIVVTKSIKNKILINIYAKNVSGVRQSNVSFEPIKGVTVISSVPRSVLGGQGFDVELEISRNNEFKGKLVLVSEPEQVIFE